ncbi:MAG: glycine cleavage system aminomethyltransferase GcvT [Bacteroidota bacterium]
MQTTALTEKHIGLGAKMAEFAGYNMPISYKGIREEHQCVRNNVGVFDVSHMGEFIIRGKQALDLIQKVSSNDASRIAIGQAQYACLPNHEGGVVDDLLIYRLGEDMCSEGEQAFMLVVNAANIEKDWNWIEQNNSFDTRMINISDHTGLLAVQGPKATEALQSLTEVNLSELKYYTFTKGRMAGIDNVLISATGYTGSGGFELYVANDRLADLWDAIFQAAAPLEIEPIGLGARDTLRLEMGYCLYGHEIDDETSPLEAGLGWITKLKKDHFNSIDIFRQQKADGISRKLVAFTVDDRRVPRQGYPILNEEGQEIGKVTSGTLSPSLGIPIGLGLIEKAYSSLDGPLKVVAGRKQLAATIVKLPFYKG